MNVTAPSPSVLVIIEQKVEGFIQEVVAGIKHEVQVIGQMLAHAAVLVPAAAARVEALTPFVEELGAAIGQPEVVAGMAAANKGMQLLNAAVSTYTKATTPGSSVTAQEAKDAISGIYQGYRDVTATYNTVKAAAVKVATQPATPAPVVTNP